MQPRERSAPDPAELQAYSLGKLDAQRAAAIEAFLADHPEYGTIFEATPDDAVVRHLRGAGDVPTITGGSGEGATLPLAPSPRHSAADRDALTGDYGSAVPADASRDTSAALANHPRYRLLRKLGEGGMGAVFLAEHRLMQRPVALKVIGAAFLNHPEAVARFRREVQAAARLSHPNIVTAHDAEEAAGIHFLAMEYVEGVPLSDWLAKHGPLAAAEACGYVRQAALGLQYAHEKGMVHRDLKPPNLMRTPDGTIKILDFGLARFACEPDRPDQGQLTAVGAVMGTADYIAPEQAQDSRTADIRADIYSLGCTLYQLLTGRVPFPQGTAADKISKHLLSQPEPLGKLRADLPAGLVQVVEKMMARAPAQRYQTPVEVAAALEPFTSTAPGRGAVRRRLRVAVAAGLLGLAAVLAALVVFRIQTDRGEIVLQTDDPSIKIVIDKAGKVVRILDPGSGQRWELDTDKYEISRADEPKGLTIALPGKEPFILKRDGKEVLRLARVVGSEPALPPRYKNGLGMEFVLVGKGTAWLGGAGGKPGDMKVDIPHDFYLGVYEVTQEEWQTVTGLNPSFFWRQGDGKDRVQDIPEADLKRFPVEQVSWDDAQAFLNRLNAREKKPGWEYRLPKEAEWEYACRGGPMTDRFESAFDFYFDKPTNQLLPEQANFNHDKALKRTCKVGSFKPNRLGLYDMHGNVWEWCDDAAKTPEGAPGRVFRGGSWEDGADICRTEIRNAFPPSDRYGNFGLRLALVPTGK